MTNDQKEKLKTIYAAMATGFDRDAFVLGGLHDIAIRDQESYSSDDAEVLRLAREQILAVRTEVCKLFERKLE